MNTPTFNDLINDAKLALDTIENGKSPVFRLSAAEWLESIAKQLLAAVATPEPAQPEPADDRPVIDLKMKYRTRDGREVTGLEIRNSLNFPIWGVVDGGARNWTREGFFVSNDTQHDFDLIPTGEPA